MRETTLIGLQHPEYIDDGAWLRVDHPTVQPLADGHPVLGWEGDPRLCVYLHLESQTFVLWRLEANQEYMPVASFGLGKEITPQSVNLTIQRLIEVDSRRGFDPGLDVLAAQEAVARDAHNTRMDALGEFADKLQYGLSRSHLPGVDVTRIRQLPSRR